MDMYAREFVLRCEELTILTLQSADIPSSLKFSNISFVDWSGNSSTNYLVDIECSSNALCDGISFASSWNVTVPSGSTPKYTCSNTVNVTSPFECG